MTKTEFIHNIAEKSNIPKKDATLVVNTIFNKMTEALVKGDRIEIRGFGSFSVKSYEGYEGKNPRTHQSIIVQPNGTINNKKPRVINPKPIYNIVYIF